jgi:hypothetical protein
MSAGQRALWWKGVYDSLEDIQDDEEEGYVTIGPDPLEQWPTKIELKDAGELDESYDSLGIASLLDSSNTSRLVPEAELPHHAGRGLMRYRFDIDSDWLINNIENSSSMDPVKEDHASEARQSSRDSKGNNITGNRIETLKKRSKEAVFQRKKERWADRARWSSRVDPKFLEELRQREIMRLENTWGKGFLDPGRESHPSDDDHWWVPNPGDIGWNDSLRETRTPSQRYESKHSMQEHEDETEEWESGEASDSRADESMGYRR